MDIRSELRKFRNEIRTGSALRIYQEAIVIMDLNDEFRLSEAYFERLAITEELEESHG